MYNAYVTVIKNLRKHPNADRLQLGECFGNTVCVSLEYTEGQVGIYFPEGGQLSVEFTKANNLLRKTDENGNNIGGYMDPNKRNVTTIKLRGEKSDGLFLPINCLESFGDISSLNIGDTISIFNGHEICTKYIPRSNQKTHSLKEGNKVRKKKAPIAPLFQEHADTEQLAYNLGAFKAGDLIEITLKMHGTSQRTGYLPTLKGYKRTLIDRLLRREGTPIYDWGYVSGTRRTVLDDYEGGYYGSNAFREDASKFFEGKLLKGEEVYYEVVGYVNDNTPIMGECKVPKEYQKDYGKKMVFSYGCEPGQHDFYVYRMTMTNEDGDVVEYSPDFMRYRCEQMGCKTVPVFWKGYIPNATNDEELVLSEDFLTNDAGEFSEWILKTPGEYIKDIAEQFYDGVDLIGKTHVREGVVVRIVNRPKFCAYKHKNFLFKMLTGLIKETTASENLSDDILSEL